MCRNCKLIRLYGEDILSSPNFQLQKNFIQHGRVSVYDHVYSVTVFSLTCSRHLPIAIDEEALVRGALLHDYFLYDWHIQDGTHKWHGFRHPARARENDVRDFSIGDKEQDMIIHHMFPLTVKPPRSREAWLLCFADKVCSVRETLFCR